MLPYRDEREQRRRTHAESCRVMQGSAPTPRSTRERAMRNRRGYAPYSAIERMCHFGHIKRGGNAVLPSLMRAVFLLKSFHL